MILTVFFSKDKVFTLSLRTEQIRLQIKNIDRYTGRLPRILKLLSAEGV